MLRPYLVLLLVSSQSLEMSLSRVVRCRIKGRRSRECTVKVVLRHFEEGGRSPKQFFGLQRRLNRGRIVACQVTRLQLPDPVPTLGHRQSAIVCQMTLK